MKSIHFLKLKNVFSPIEFSNVLSHSTVRKKARGAPLKSPLNFTKNNQAQFGTIMFFILVIVIIAAILYVLLSADPSCDLEDQITIEGKLLGFQKNNSYHSFFDVKVGNKTYLFKFFKENYMTQLVGNNVILTCCKRIHDYNPREYYDFLNCFIKEV